MNIFINSLFDRETLSVEIDPKFTISQLKTIIADKTTIYEDDQILSFGGFPLRDQEIISETTLRNNCTIEMGLRLRGGTSQPTPKSLALEKPTDLKTCEAYFKDPLRNQGNERIVKQIRKMKDVFLERIEFELYPDKKLFQETLEAKVLSIKCQQSKYFFILLANGDIHCYSFETKEKLYTIKEEGASAIEICSENMHLIIGTETGTLKIYSLERNEFIGTLEHVHAGKI
jgi:hypothetical protein